MRRLWVLVTHLPPESALGALGRDGKPHWSIEAHLLDDLRMAMTGTKEKPAKPHPGRPQGGNQQRRINRRAFRAAQRRAAERRAAIAAGEIT